MASAGEMVVSIRLHRARLHRGRVELGMEIQGGLKAPSMYWSPLEVDSDLPLEDVVATINRAIQRGDFDEGA